VVSIANAIAQEEGFNVSGSIAQRNNNPGNLRSGPSQSGAASGYATYANVTAGWQDLYSLIQKIIGYGVNLYQFFGGGLGYPGYAPAADSNQPAAYANFVAAQTGIDPNVPLNSLDPNSFASTAATSNPAPAAPCDPASDPVCTGTDASGNPCEPSTDPNCGNSSPSGGSSGSSSTTTIIAVGIAALVGLWVVSRLFD
jgi:hypothetical protein